MFDYERRTDDELIQKLILINERLVYAGSIHVMMANQLNTMKQMIEQELSDRNQKRMMDAKLEREPEVRDFSEQKKMQVSTDKKSRAKARSDIIGKMKRTRRPPSIKDS